MMACVRVCVCVCVCAWLVNTQTMSDVMNRSHFPQSDLRDVGGKKTWGGGDKGSMTWGRGTEGVETEGDGIIVKTTTRKRKQAVEMKLSRRLP